MAQKVFKRNYEELLKSAIPLLYFNNEVEASGTQVSIEDTLINSIINFCANQPLVLGVSAVGDVSSINTTSGISSWFIPQNNKAYEILASKFEIDILHKLDICTGKITGSPCTWSTGASAVDPLDLSGTYREKLLSVFKDTLLPKITLNSPTLHETTNYAFAPTASGTHEYLVDNLGWLYFLNTSGDSFDSSSYVAEALVDMYMSSTPYTVKDGVKGVLEYIWKNWSSVSSISTDLLPISYYSGTSEYASGTQNLDKLKTLVDVVYDTGPISNDDTYVYDAFIDFIDNGYVLESRESTGPFSKFIKGASYAFFDTNNNAQLLDYLYDLEKCPDNLLKYVAELIGWNLKGSSPLSWRRQLKFAMKLYKQKGTKEGLYNALTTVLPGTSIETSSISEFYESYVPFLIYYLLKTDTTIFDSFDTWTPDEAAHYCQKEYSYSDMDYNVRVVIDHMLLRALKRYPDLFYVNNFKFDLDNPDFVFNYRDRDFPIPPWEEIKFYKDVDARRDLISSLKDELLCLGVSKSSADYFYNYIVDNTSGKNLDARFYNNSFIFFTSSLDRAPNEIRLLENKEYTKYDYLSLWNSKSSHFNVSVSSTSFDDEFINSSLFNRADFFQSLSIVDEFSPAKSIARTNVDLTHVDQITNIDFTCPSVRYVIHDLSLSGALGGYTTSGVDIRNIAGTVGGDYTTPPNSSRAYNTHTNLPVFKRDMVDASFDKIHLAGSSVSAPPLVDLERSNVRRRDFSKTLKKSGWYTRTGFNMPSYYNLSNQGSEDIDFYVLGFINSQYRYNPVVNYKNLYEVSSWPYDNSVWTDCWIRTSDYSLCTIPASSTFDIRGRDSITPSSCNSYVLRERTHEFNDFLYDLLDMRFEAKAEAIYKKNNFLLDTSSFRNPVLSIKNDLINRSTLELEDLYSSILGKRIMSRDSIDGVHKSFKDYISYFTNTGIGNGLLDTYKNGGPNILSHTYGPLFYNGYFEVDGSAVDTSSSLVSKDTVGYPFTVSSLSSLNNITANTVDDMYVEFTEIRNPYVLSGVEFVDSIPGNSEFTIYNLDSSNASIYRDNYTINNPFIRLNSKSPFPRLRFNLKDYGTASNLLIPERDFKVTVRGNFGTEGNLTLGDGTFGVWIHTDVETDYNGNKVFWNYMPDGTWSMLDASMLQNQGAVNLVKYSLSHYLNYEETQDLDPTDQCFSKNIIGYLEEDNFIEKSINFDTRNQKIKVPYSYFKKETQVHRPTQNYIIEVFQYDNTLPDTFAILDYVSIQDLRLFDRTNIKYPVEYEDFSKYSTETLLTYRFYNENGVAIQEDDPIILDSDGNMTNSSGEKLTCLIADDINAEYLSKGQLYSQITTTYPEVWFKDVQGNVVNLKSQQYNGIIKVDTSGNITPSSITIVGKTKGSNILMKETLYLPISPEQLLIVLREFKRLQEDEGSRDKAISVIEYGAEGGSRLNYKFAPMWSQTGGYTEFEARSRQYTDVYLEN